MTYTIHHRFTTLNDYIKAERTNRYCGAKIKKSETNVARLSVLNKQPISVPCRLKFTWYVKDKRTDPDNIAFAKKFILDGFVDANILPKDSMKYITGFIDEFEISKQEKVVIEVIE